ncbi:MAG TPA: HD domain-containing protein [Thermomicrobiales bacterium]|nr:HD domain-containing protein [Thermomicrobiales bacterium]
MTAQAALSRYLPKPEWYRHGVDPRGIHGVAHAARVLYWADVLARQIAAPGALRGQELRWAAALHDVGRANEGIDPGHGARSAAWVLANLATERPETAALDLDFIAELSRWHEAHGQDVPLMTLELLILKDADALDRARIGDLDPSRLRLTRATRLVDDARALERATNRYGAMTEDAVLRAADRLFGGKA